MQTKTAQQIFQTVSIPVLVEQRSRRLVAEQIWRSLHEPVQKKFRNHFGWRAVPLQNGWGSERTVTWERKLCMYERVYCPQCSGDSGSVASELSIRIPPPPRGSRLAKWQLVLLVLGCALLGSGCANDSTDDNTQHRHHRHGKGGGREQTETVDRSSDPSPTPALGL
jgi:hypothetical protein